MCGKVVDKEVTINKKINVHNKISQSVLKSHCYHCSEADGRVVQGHAGKGNVVRTLVPTREEEKK